MALVPCPACGLPRAADADTACPACRWAAAPSPPEVTPAPAVAQSPPAFESEPALPRGPLFLAAAGGLAVGAIATLLLAPTDPPAPTPSDTEVVGAAPAAPAYQRVPSLPVAPPPRTVEATEPDPIAVPVPFPVDPNGGYAVLKIDDADELVQFPRLGAGNRVKLVGRAKRLHIEGLDGGAELDASGLETGGVTVAEAIDGAAILRVKADSGTVAFRRGIRGGAVVEVDGPKAYVVLGGGTGAKTGPAVSGGSRVTLRVKSVEVGAPIIGAGTVLDVTFSPMGSLRLNAVEDGGLVRYRSGHRADPPVRVTPGRVTTGGEVREDPRP